MAKEIRFTFLVDEGERETIRALAERLQRTQSDAVRLVVRQAVKDTDLARWLILADTIEGPNVHLSA